MENANNLGQQAELIKDEQARQNAVSNPTSAGSLEDAPTPPLHGRWVPIDSSEIDFTVSGDLNQPIQGPDGHIYCMGNSEPTLAPVNSSANAIPRPSAIIQMPSIVQPISLVPYTSQNQPMLQYDPYSRPLPPEAPQDAPRYKKKPYKGLSLALALIAFIALVLPLIFNIALGVLSPTGLDLVKAVLNMVGIKDYPSFYYNTAIAPMSDFLREIEAKPYDAIAILSFPFIYTLIALFTLFLILKYIIRIAKSKSPRGFSLLALGNILLGGLLIFIIYGISLGMDAQTQPMPFLLGQTPMSLGHSVYLILVLNLLLLVLPFTAKKYAHILDMPVPQPTYYFPPN